MSDIEPKSISYRKIIKIAVIFIVAVVAINIIVAIIKVITAGGNFAKDVVKTVLGPFILLGGETSKACDKQKDCNNDQNYSSTKSKCEDEATCFWDENITACQNATKRKVGTTDTGKCIGFILLDIITVFGLFGVMGAFYKFRARTSDISPSLKDLSKKIDGLDLYEVKKLLKEGAEADLTKEFEEFNKKQKEKGEAEITSESGKKLYGEMNLRKKLAETSDKITREAGQLTSSEKSQIRQEIYQSHTTAYDKIKVKRETLEKKSEISKEENKALEEAGKELKPERPKPLLETVYLKIVGS